MFRVMNIHLPAILMWTTGIKGNLTHPENKDVLSACRELQGIGIVASPDVFISVEEAHVEW